jgi:hypothetical protein
MIYNPRIYNAESVKVEGDYYSLSIPPTVLDLMSATNSFEQPAQKELAGRFARHYEHAQSLLRPVKETLRFYTVDPGGDYWILDNGRNLRVLIFHGRTDRQIKFELNTDLVRLVDYVVDPLEYGPMETWGGVEALIEQGAEQRFGEGTAGFLREANIRQLYMRKEIIRRYGMEGRYIPYA